MTDDALLSSVDVCYRENIQDLAEKVEKWQPVCLLYTCIVNCFYI